MLKLPELTSREQTYGSIILILTAFIYYKYYGHLLFNDPSPFTTKGPIPDDYGITITGYEGHTTRFFMLHGFPFFLATVLFKEWRMKQSFVLSAGVWIAVFLYCATFRFNEFLRIHPDAYQCGATLVSHYPLMGVSVVFGTLAGLMTRKIAGSLRSNP